MQTGMMDMEFEALRELLPNITLNTTAAREHVGEIERKIRTIKRKGKRDDQYVPIHHAAQTYGY
jgi:hypothetical protein